MSTPNSGHVDQVKTNKEIEEDKTKRQSTYLVRTVLVQKS